jgi:hypothetical protein
LCVKAFAIHPRLVIHVHLLETVNGMLAEEIHLKRLQVNCSVTLERFVQIARGTCEILSTLRKLPMSKDRRLALYQQRRREDEALAGYQKAARALLAALEIQPDPAVAEPLPPRPSGKSRAARVNTRRRSMASGHPRTGT